MTTSPRVEPPEELRDRRWYWLTNPGNETRPTVTDPFRYQRGNWWMHGQWYSPEEAAREGWCYVAPCLTPAEAAALRAERDAAVARAEALAEAAHCPTDTSE